MDNKNTKSTGGKRAALITLCVVLGIVLALLLTGTIFVTQKLGKINRPGNNDPLTPDQLASILADDDDDEDATGPSVNKDDINWGGDVEIVESGENIINILLIGQDARGNERARSDSMILCTFNKEENTLTMTSFLRDLYVRIPGYYDQRINVPYLLGGMELLDETLEYNFGVQVDGNVEVNFGYFSEIIEVLGGVDIELTGAEARYINNQLYQEAYPDLTEGMQHLNGKQALTYARIRKVGGNGDFGRTERQRKLINSLIEKFRNSDLTTMLGLLDQILPMFTTDMSNSKIISLAMELFPMLADMEIVSQRIPADGDYYLAMVDEMSVIIADMDACRELLKETLTDGSPE